MNYRTEHFELKAPSELDKATWISIRKGETRLGQEVLLVAEGTEDWKQKRYHILGICEDLGPRANGGFGGSERAFSAFIQRFMAVQSNRFLNGKAIAVHGVVLPLGGQSLKSLNELVSELDELVSAWVKQVVEEGGIPIVIGGGHNNAYGLIKGSSLALDKAIHSINLDPHADTRDLEGRHSGNPFSYAWKEGFLEHYTVLGLHESYNNEAILERLDEMKATVAYFESWIDDPGSFREDVEKASEQLAEKSLGIELDLDSMHYMPSSAFTPSGISVEQARFYVRKLARLKQVCYLHLPEGAPKTEKEEIIVGKTLVYLVTDFIKCNGK